jgi:RNA polymerase sigma factor (sigma-70 family)
MESQPTTWEELCVQFYSRLYAKARKQTGNADNALDLVQETILRVLSSSCDFQQVKEPLAYVFKSMNNIFIDEVRKAKRSPATSLDDPRLLERQTEIPGYQPTMQDELEYKELLETIRRKSDRLIARLSADERELYELWTSGMTIPQISKIRNEDIRITRADCYALKAKLRYRATHWK